MPIVGVVEKELVWVIIIVVLVAIGGGASNKNEPTKVGENSGSNVSNQEAEEKTDFAVGDVISYEGREVTVVSVERNYNSNNEFYQPESGKEFVKVSIKIENKSSEKLSYNSYDWELQDSDGDIQSIDAGLQFTVDGALNSGDLAPNGKKSVSPHAICTKCLEYFNFCRLLFYLCLFVLFENFGCKNLKHTIFEPLKLLFSLL